MRPACATLNHRRHTLLQLNSGSAVIGYYVYSGIQASVPFARLNSTPVPATTYTDDTVQSGQTYYYFVTAVDSSGVESADSNEVSAAIP
jgi:fibronectin type 3 domain-containing protein